MNSDVVGDLQGEVLGVVSRKRTRSELGRCQEKDDLLPRDRAELRDNRPTPRSGWSHHRPAPAQGGKPFTEVNPASQAACLALITWSAAFRALADWCEGELGLRAVDCAGLEALLD